MPFLEKQDVNYTKASCPLLLSTRVHVPTEISSSYITGESRYDHTGRRHLNGHAMDYWVDMVRSSLYTSC
jgi:hypothetical protein